MGVEELRDSVNGIRMKEDMRRAVIENVTRRTQQPDGRQTEQEGSGKIMQNRKKSRIMKNLAAAALVVAVIGVAAVPVRALVNSLVKERMEEMPQEEKEHSRNRRWKPTVIPGHIQRVRRKDIRSWRANTRQEPSHGRRSHRWKVRKRRLPMSSVS